MADSNKHYSNTLPKGCKLDNFKIISVLGAGGFGVAYLAEDTYLNELCVIKEYMPNEFAYRDQASGEIHPISPDNADNYAWGLNEFLEEAKTIKKCKHHNIVEVIRFFEAYNSAYFVMPYFEGDSLSQLLQQLPPDEIVTEQEIKDIVMPLLDGLKVLHAQNIFHRDIKPSNIYICDKNNTPILIDFGAARFSLGAHSRSITAIVTPCYSPHEQYHQHGKQGAWTDIYSMGAVMYRLISGKMPIDSPARICDDFLVPATEVGKGQYSDHLLSAIDHALALKEDDRPQSIEAWLLEINGEVLHEIDPEEKLGSDNPTPLIPIPPKPIPTPVIPTMPTVAWAVIVVLLAGISMLMVKVFQSEPSSQINTENTFQDIVREPEQPSRLVDTRENTRRKTNETIKKWQLEWVGKKIFQNETSGNTENLIFWGKNESFPSLGIGHFIWYPADQIKKYTETFPQLIRFLDSNNENIPQWLREQIQHGALWGSRVKFKQSKTTNDYKTLELRELLKGTKSLQTAFIAQRLMSALPNMLKHLDSTIEKERIISHFNSVRDSDRGFYPLLDYVHFKGEGISPSERYKGQGWGLLQVLQEMNDVPAGKKALREFVRAAGTILERRVRNSPVGKNEGRWLKGWKKRLGSYTDI